MFIVCAPAGVYVSVAGIPTPLGRVDPSLQVHSNFAFSFRDSDRLFTYEIFRTAPAFHGVLPIRETHGFTVGTIDLGMKIHIRSEAHGLERINPIDFVLDSEG